MPNGWDFETYDRARWQLAAATMDIMASLGETAARAKETVAAVVCTEEARARALAVARAFRDAGIRTEMDLMGRGFGAQLAHAAKSADFAIIIGQREAASGAT